MEIEIDLDTLTIGDLETLDRAAQGNLPMSELVDLLDRVVAGGARHLPLSAMRKIIAALNDQIAAVANQGN